MAVVVIFIIVELMIIVRGFVVENSTQPVTINPGILTVKEQASMVVIVAQEVQEDDTQGWHLLRNIAIIL